MEGIRWVNFLKLLMYLEQGNEFENIVEMGGIRRVGLLTMLKWVVYSVVVWCFEIENAVFYWTNQESLFDNYTFVSYGKTTLIW